MGAPFALVFANLSLLAQPGHVKEFDMNEGRYPCDERIQQLHLGFVRHHCGELKRNQNLILVGTTQAAYAIIVADEKRLVGEDSLLGSIQLVDRHLCLGTKEGDDVIVTCRETLQNS